MVGSKLGRSIGVLGSIFLVLLCVGNYYNSLTNEFAFDDYLAIVNNADVLDRTGKVDIILQYGGLWHNDLWGKDLQADDSHRSYRPLLTTLFKLITQLCGLNASIFRMVSIFFHCTATLSVWTLTSAIFGNDSLAFGCSILFACHPVHVESVAAVVNMAEAASLTLSVVGYLIYYRSSNGSSEEHNPLLSSTDSFAQSGMKKQMLHILSFFCLLVTSVLFKETGIVLCGVIVASAGVSLLSSLKKSYLSCINQEKRRKEHQLQSNNGSNRNQNDQDKMDEQQKFKGVFSGLTITVLKWLNSHGLWVLSSFIGVFAYSLFRVALLTPSGLYFMFIDIVVGIIYGISNGTLTEEIEICLINVLNKIYSYRVANHISSLSSSPSMGSIYSTLGYLTELKGSVAKSYLGDSQLIRKAENPFAFLVGEEKVLSLMVRNVFFICLGRIHFYFYSTASFFCVHHFFL